MEPLKATFLHSNLDLCLPQVSSDVGGGWSGSIWRCCGKFAAFKCLTCQKIKWNHSFEVHFYQQTSLQFDIKCEVHCLFVCDHQVECNSKMDPTTTSFLKVPDPHLFLFQSKHFVTALFEYVCIIDLYYYLFLLLKLFFCALASSSLHRWLMQVVFLSWLR